MFKKFITICSVIGLSLLILSAIGLSSLSIQAKAIRSDRQQEFIAVAKKVRFDVKKKLDDFLLKEQNRPYTDYQHYYVPMAANNINALVKSPLSELFSNGMAKGYFQLDSNNNISNPHAHAPDQASTVLNDYLNFVRSKLLPSLGNGTGLKVARIEPTDNKIIEKDYISSFNEYVNTRQRNDRSSKTKNNQQLEFDSEPQSSRSKRYSINIENESQQSQTQSISRDNYLTNTYANNSSALNEQTSETQNDLNAGGGLGMGMMVLDMDTQKQSESNILQDSGQLQNFHDNYNYQQLAQQTEDIVQARIEPFVPMTVESENGSNGIFAGQVFMLRHVQIENDHFLQGFMLDEAELQKQVAESANKFLLRGMGYNISKQEQSHAAFTAVLDFGFGELALNMLELETEWVQDRVAYIRNWFFAILTVVWMAVIISLAMMWKNMLEQVQLSRKKDDFISAVSHELRTPLTSIRMYTEMLENNWVKTDDKRCEYYSNMRQESERLTRLIENVLDFSRIQRGKKRYVFSLGNINECIGNTVTMMKPYAEQAGFTIRTEFSNMQEFSFDHDAVVQIVVNLLDNALKYARDADNKEILVRTSQSKGYVYICVQDYGPGIAHSQQKKIFEEFYRCGDESTRQTTGTGLGLALVRRFAEAHKGFVDFTNTRPTGALFKVALKTNA